MAPKSHTHTHINTFPRAHISLLRIPVFKADLSESYPIVKRKTNNALRYLGFGTDLTTPGNGGVVGQLTNNGHPSLLAGEEGWMSAACMVDGCGPAVLPALALFGMP